MIAYSSYAQAGANSVGGCGKGTEGGPCPLRQGGESQKDCFLYDRTQEVFENKGPHLAKMRKTNSFCSVKWAQTALKNG
jgi:hypothetical protein